MKYAAVIVETRKIEGFRQIVENHMRHLPDDWRLWIFGGSDNSDFIHQEMLGREYVHSTKAIRTVTDYNKELLDVDFWNNLAMYDRVLIFQSDSGLLRSGIEEFLPYSYVGAPWSWAQEGQKGGNGGLSLRDPKEMIRALLNHKPQGENEDVFFSNHCDNVAPREVCDRFSVETIFKLGAMGVHAISKYLTAEQCEQINQQYLFNATKKPFEPDLLFVDENLKTVGYGMSNMDGTVNFKSAENP